MLLRTVLRPILLAAFFALCAPTASQAQYFNNSYSLLYPLSYLLRGGGGYGYNSYSNPFYLLNTVGRNSYYSPLGYMPYSSNGGNLSNYQNGPFSYGQGNNNNNNQSNYNPATNTSQLSGQAGSNPYQQYYPQSGNNSNANNSAGNGSNPQPQLVRDQIAYSNRYKQQQQPQQTSQFQPQTQQQANQQGYPSPAPSSHNVGGIAKTGGSTFANSFIDTLETKYHGNLDVAFRDRDFVSWAQALNIPVKNAHQFATIGSVRKQAINSVLKDSSLDSSAKIQALKVLLR